MIVNFHVPKISLELACFIRDYMTSKQIAHWAISHIVSMSPDVNVVCIIDRGTQEVRTIRVDARICSPEFTIISMEVN